MFPQLQHSAVQKVLYLYSMFLSNLNTQRPIVELCTTVYGLLNHPDLCSCKSQKVVYLRTVSRRVLLAHLD